MLPERERERDPLCRMWLLFLPRYEQRATSLSFGRRPDSALNLENWNAISDHLGRGKVERSVWIEDGVDGNGRRSLGWRVRRGFGRGRGGSCLWARVRAKALVPRVRFRAAKRVAFVLLTLEGARGEFVL